MAATSGRLRQQIVLPSLSKPIQRSMRRRAPHAAAQGDPSGSMPNSTSQGAAAAAHPASLQKRLIQQVLATAVVGAVLGPVCDGLHSAADVLHYSKPLFLRLGAWQLETCWWVSPLFGSAAVLLGVSLPLLDLAWGGSVVSGQPQPGSRATSSFAASPQHGSKAQAGSSLHQPVEGQVHPEAAATCDSSSSSQGLDLRPQLRRGWLHVFMAATAFILQYWLSGQLSSPRFPAPHLPMGLPAADSILAVCAVLTYLLFDCTAMGLVVAVVAALLGPVVEITLSSGYQLFYYTRPDSMGVPSWLCWLYVAAAAAVGSLGRQLWGEEPRRAAVMVVGVAALGVLQGVWLSQMSWFS